MKKTMVCIIIGIMISLMGASLVFAQPFSATALPEASDPKPTTKLDDQDQNNDSQGNNKTKDSSEGIALILSSPLPSFRTQS